MRSSLEANWASARRSETLAKRYFASTMARYASLAFASLPCGALSPGEPGPTPPTALLSATAVEHGHGSPCCSHTALRTLLWRRTPLGRSGVPSCSSP
eukprot:6648854-Prymnesium_polylepis.1